MFGIILRYFLKAVIAIEIICLVYYLWKIAVLVIAEYNSAKSYQDLQEISSEKVLISEKTINVVKNLKEIPYQG